MCVSSLLGPINYHIGGGYSSCYINRSRTANTVTLDTAFCVKWELFAGKGNVLLFALMHMEGEAPKLQALWLVHEHCIYGNGYSYPSHDYSFRQCIIMEMKIHNPAWSLDERFIRR
jgi:hypothetical protein